MPLQWIREKPAYWDASKRGIVGEAPAGTFGDKVYDEFADGAALPGDWFRVEDGGATVGYGWMDITWGDAEILLAVDPGHRPASRGSRVPPPQSPLPTRRRKSWPSSEPLNPRLASHALN
jgi:hypothetical protein